MVLSALSNVLVICDRRGVGARVKPYLPFLHLVILLISDRETGNDANLSCVYDITMNR